MDFFSWIYILQFDALFIQPGGGWVEGDYVMDLVRNYPSPVKDSSQVFSIGKKLFLYSAKKFSSSVILGYLYRAHNN